MRALFHTVLLILLSHPAWADSFSAQVSRTTLTAGETLDLILESSDTTPAARPDLTPLNTLFNILGTRQVNQISDIAGKRASKTRWIISLQPKHMGYVVIPPLQLNGKTSKPITLHIEEDNPTADSGTLAPVFIDTSLDQESVYVQAQAVLTLRIYHSVSLYDDSSLTPLQIPNARVEQLGKTRTYEKVIAGVRHGVIELRYAIHPQYSGDLIIPGQRFRATLVDRQQPGAFRPFGARPGPMAEVQSPDIPLAVKPKPADFPANVPWLPARSLSIDEAWVPESGEIRTGDSLTRNLILKADGLSSAQLPALSETRIAGLRYYPDQPRLHDEISENGLTGTREESLALVPTRPGEITLPAVEVFWWNTRADRLEHTSLPARTLNILEDPASQALPDSDPQPAIPVPAPRLWPWQLSTLLLGCTTLLGFLLWWRARERSPARQPQMALPSERALLDELKRACLNNDPLSTRQALDAWARQQPETLADMATRHEALDKALQALNSVLFSEAEHHWQGQPLWQAVNELPPLHPTTDDEQDSSTLPPLYPR